MKNLSRIQLVELFESEQKCFLDLKNIKNKFGISYRLPNISEVVSENTIKFLLQDMGIDCHNAKVGDLIVDGVHRYECKSFSSNAPISFGPKESWKKLIVMDSINLDKIKVYQVNLRNVDNEWLNIKINKTETFKHKIEDKKRPRIKWKKLYPQIKRYTDVLYSGNIKSIIYT